jgi:spore photoproduct lyase
MQPLHAEKLYILPGVKENPKAWARAERLRPFIHADAVEEISDEQLAAIVKERELLKRPRHGMAGVIRPLVFFNVFHFDDSEQTRAQRRQAFPDLFKQDLLKLHSYGGFDWRDTGSREWRARTGLVCQPAYAMHSIVGCHFRCAYCSLGWFHNIMLNLEDFGARLDGWLAGVQGQTLYQYDNWTDIACFEPEYGMSKLLVEYFAGREKEYLELYVGKSDEVDCLLSLDHRRHTTVCWSVSGQTQSTRIERGSAPMARRIEAARRCQEAGYHVRIRFSPIVPVRNWQRENREMIEALFASVTPEVVTFEPIRYLSYDAIRASIDPDLLDPEFLEGMKTTLGTKHPGGSEIPDPLRLKMYRFIIDEIERVSPKTPYALCREERKTWEALASDFARHGMDPDKYVCNCGPTSAPGNPLLAICKPRGPRKVA